MGKCGVLMVGEVEAKGACGSAPLGAPPHNNKSLGHGRAEREHRVGRVHADGLDHRRAGDGALDRGRIFHHHTFGQLLVHQLLQADGVEKISS